MAKSRFQQNSPKPLPTRKSIIPYTGKIHFFSKQPISEKQPILKNGPYLKNPYKSF
jgi:hypothetical protein